MSMSKQKTVHNAGNILMFLFSCVIMQRYAAVITVVCILLCLTFNYTFPLRRVGNKWYPGFFHNLTHTCDASPSHDNIADRSKKMAINIDDSNRKIKNFNRDVTVDGLATDTKHSAEKNPLSEDDLRQYEQLVIMKKYPYLDRKELEIKFRPSSGKNARQSVKINGGPAIAGDPGFCEPVDEGPNVEIINRGLTGFAIPAKLSKATNIMETKQKLNAEVEDTGFKSDKLTKPDVLGSLQYDIRKYEERKRDNNKYFD